MSVEAARGVCSDIIGMVKINATLLCRDTIENMKKYFPGVSHIVLKRNYMFPG